MILHRNEEPEVFFTSRISTFSVRLVSQMKIMGIEEVLGFCYTYNSIKLNEIEMSKLFQSIWHHFNTIQFNQYGEHGFDIIVVFKNKDHMKIFKEIIEGKEKSFDYKIIYLLESDVLFVGPIS